ncbi:MAG: CRISPR-associated helicase Cas3' [Methylococcus sp.]
MPADEFTSRFWGKLNFGPDGTLRAWLSLSQHCLDVARVFYRLIQLRSIRLRLEASAGRPLDEVILQRMAVIALLHDVGKTNLGFQDKPFASSDQPVRAGHIRELGPMFVDADLQARFVEAIEAETLCGWFESPESAMAYLIAAWSHHGKPQVYQDVPEADHRVKAAFWQARGGRDPFRAIAELLTMARKTFPAAFAPDGAPIPHATALQHRFAGLVMLADWLGSHRGFFPLQGVDEPAPKRSPEDALSALRAVGFDAAEWQARLADHPSDFAARFGFPPRALQDELDRWPTSHAGSRLLIAEAETGAGKTEAALARFFRLFAAREVDALYFALPTRVAARELYQRVAAYVEKLFPAKNRPPVLLAVPGYARVDNVPVDRLLPGDDTRYQDEAAQARLERLWAAEHPKRFLAAPVAVGTIDQALLSALQTPHAHLRSVCLDRSLLVVDEVHASDPYMRRLLHGLLDHHLKMGGHALLLSATLGSRARTQFTGHPEPDLAAAIATPYPAVTDSGGIPRGLPPEANPPKRVRFDIRPVLEQPEVLLTEIAEALARGARVLVVLNTVGRAIALQRAAEANPSILPHLFRCQDVVAPHHGRFAPVDREALDQAVTDALGKNSPAGARLLIGTQTLEQSLDIDADLLITDLCPMDILLQRIGRLQRHWERPRPVGFEPARCVMLVPVAADLEALLDAKGEAIGTAKRAGLGSVYPDLRVLQLTRDATWARPDVEIPRDNRRLVEEATHAERLATLTGTRWEKHAQNVEGGDLAKGVRAAYAGLANLYRLPFGDVGCQFRDNEEARTRLGLDALRVPLDQAMTSPFGAPLTEVLIPGHLADSKSTDERATVLARETDGSIILTHGAHRYRYSRHGLEKLDE